MLENTQLSEKIFLFAENLVVIIVLAISTIKSEHYILHSHKKSYTIYSIESEILLHRLLTFIRGICSFKS